MQYDVLTNPTVVAFNTNKIAPIAAASFAHPIEQ
ncbi:hypothetical protein V3C99_015743 [Haemonchus contortus]